MSSIFCHFQWQTEIEKMTSTWWWVHAGSIRLFVHLNFRLGLSVILSVWTLVFEPNSMQSLSHRPLLPGLQGRFSGVFFGLALCCQCNFVNVQAHQVLLWDVETQEQLCFKHVGLVYIMLTCTWFFNSPQEGTWHHGEILAEEQRPTVSMPPKWNVSEDLEASLLPNPKWHKLSVIKVSAFSAFCLICNSRHKSQHEDVNYHHKFTGEGNALRRCLRNVFLVWELFILGKIFSLFLKEGTSLPELTLLNCVPPSVFLFGSTLCVHHFRVEEEERSVSPGDRGEWSAVRILSIRK